MPREATAMVTQSRITDRKCASDVRPSAVAGQWYPGTRDALLREVDAHLASAGPRRRRAAARARSSRRMPGLLYSGPVAAWAYALVRECRYAAVVLVGPSHFVGFRGVSIWPRGEWQTPLGAVAVADRLAAAIAAESDRDRRASAGARARAFAGDAAAVRRAPAAGCADRAARDGVSDARDGDGARRRAWTRPGVAARVGRRRHPARRQQRSVALRGCGDGGAPRRRGAAARRGARRRRPDGRARTRTAACVRRRTDGVGAARGRRGSGRPARECSGTPTPATCPATSRRSSATWRRRSGDRDTSTDQQRLLALARRALEARVRREPPPAPDRGGALESPRGAFVTIHCHGDLRGCLGRLDPDEPLGGHRGAPGGVCLGFRSALRAGASRRAG